MDNTVVLEKEDEIKSLERFLIELEINKQKVDKYKSFYHPSQFISKDKE